MLIILIQAWLLQILSSTALMFELNNEHLRLYINCNSVIQDSSTNQIQISNFGTTFTEDRHLQAAKACKFDGTGYLIGSADLLPSTYRTITFWFTSDLEMSSTLLSYGGTGKCTGLSIDINFKNKQSPKYVFHTFCTSIDAIVLSSNLSLYSLPRWTHMALTIGPTGNSMYINGDKVASNDAKLENTDVIGKQFTIGLPTLPSALGGVFDMWPLIGAMDEIRIYDIWYPSENIRDIYRQENNTPPSLAQDLSTTVIYQKSTQIYELITKYFRDADNDDLEYDIQMQNGSPLPSWLSYSSGSIFASASETVPGTYNLIIKARDAYSFSPDFLFILQVEQISCNLPGHSLVNNECIACGDKIPNCKSCKGTNIGDCLECEDNYTLNSSGRCEYNCWDENCIKCSKDFCSQCIDGYGVVLQSFNCKKCTNSLCATCQFGSKEICTSCVTNYERESENSNSCIEIFRYCTDSSCMSCSTKNSGNAISFIKGSTCHQMCPVKNCLECSTSNSCKTCLPNYTLDDNGCYSTNCPDNCDLCSQTACVACHRGFFIDSKGECVSFYIVVFPIVFSVGALIVLLLLICCVIRIIRRKRMLILARIRQRQNHLPNQPHDIIIANINPNNPDLPNPSIIELMVDNPQSESKRKKCILCPSTMIFGKTSCGCYLCYRHCNEMKFSLRNPGNIFNYQKCPDHQIKIEEILELKEENQLPAFEIQRVNSQDSMQGKCMICFEGESRVSFNCGCRALVCTNCYENHVGIYRHTECPFCRRMVNAALENKN